MVLQDGSEVVFLENASFEEEAPFDKELSNFKDFSRYLGMPVEGLMKIKILAWNVRGLNDREKRRIFNLVVRAQKVDLVCCLETKVSEMSLKLVKSLGVGRFTDWGAVYAGGASGGILIFWVLELLELEPGVYSISGRFRNVEDGFIWVFTGVYGPVLSRAKEKFWEELGAIKGLWDEPWCVGGDFNSIRFPGEMRGIKKGKTPFRFENMWLMSDGFKELVRAWWTGYSVVGSTSHCLAEKLKALKRDLRRWNKEVFGNVSAKKSEALSRIQFWDSKESLNPLSSEEAEARLGDLEEYKKARKNFLSKVNINGNSLTSAEDIKDGVCRAYRTLARSLEEPFSEKEVFEALCSLSGDKAPNPDGFTMAFWQFSWDFTKVEILAFFDEFFRHGNFQRSLNSTFLVLIPKKGGAEELKDFRPISLVGSLYKLLAKVLANRQILDAALIANEAVDSRLKVNIPGLLLKLDFEKVFDHVNWDCLVSVMSKMGFRGLRQGDPLSPYLFLLVMEVLSQLLFRARSGDYIEGFKVGNTNGIERDLLHLLFADDTLLFCKANSGQLRYLSWVFLWFEAISGLKVNKDKSEAIPVGRVDYLENIVSVLGCRIGKLPSSYLGLPLGAPFKSPRVWDVVEERFKSACPYGRDNIFPKGEDLP
ncbi:LINE-1 retrotransposable element ORF2 protein [Vitis vinifera]|uniref:LINE-1 retrotransposable element ORF2 protein n=1 Tax=Vitis vinifera TaxID=29760 RepID=A0A438D8E6_VITVI|nr:LINE-1 retrotransposable element ORF2 protein [Vitis vinifera]